MQEGFGNPNLFFLLIVETSCELIEIESRS